MVREMWLGAHRAPRTAPPQPQPQPLSLTLTLSLALTLTLTLTLTTDPHADDCPSASASA